MSESLSGYTRIDRAPVGPTKFQPGDLAMVQSPTSTFNGKVVRVDRTFIRETRWKDGSVIARDSFTVVRRHNEKVRFGPWLLRVIPTGNVIKLDSPRIPRRGLSDEVVLAQHLQLGTPLPDELEGMTLNF